MKLMYLCIIACFGTITCHARDEELFLQANNLYASKEYQQAYDTYLSMSTKGNAVLYNMGNCACQLADYDRARQLWSCALKGSSRAQRVAIQHNLAIAHVRAGDEAHSEPFKISITNMIACVPILIWQLLFFLVWVLLLWAVKQKRLLFMGCLLIINLAVGVCLVVGYHRASTPAALVLNHDVVLFAGPDTRYDTIASVPEFAHVEIDQVEGHWCKVCYQEFVGWVPADKLILL